MTYIDWSAVFTGVSTVFSAIAMLVSGYMSIKQAAHTQRITALEGQVNGSSPQSN